MSKEPDPVSWLLLEPGAEVVDPSGKKLGRVEEVLGDLSKDIFDGLMVSSGLFERPRYVPAERVARIYEGRVVLDLTAEEFHRLDERGAAVRIDRTRP